MANEEPFMYSLKSSPASCKLSGMHRIFRPMALKMYAIRDTLVLGFYWHSLRMKKLLERFITSQK